MNGFIFSDNDSLRRGDGDVRNRTRARHHRKIPKSPQDKFQLPRF